jgi:hypothetical protein
MSDKLSAASLLLAIVAVLYGMWYPHLTQALAAKIPPHEPDRRKPKTEIRLLRNQRAIPLAAAAIGVALVFLPDAMVIIAEGAGVLKNEGLRLQNYDSVATAFVLVELVSIYLAFHFAGVLIEFRSLLKRLSSPTGAGVPVKK